MPIALRMLLVAAFSVAAGWFGHQVWSEHRASQTAAGASPAGAPGVAGATRPHNYEFRDGMDYGYKRALSADQVAAGQATASLVMFRYAGERDGKHQVHSSDGNVFTALECERPCRVIKVLSFVDADYLRDNVRVERLEYQPGTIAASVMDDAFAGRLNQYGMSRGNKAFQVWVDERGRREFAVKSSAQPAQ